MEIESDLDLKQTDDLAGPRLRTNGSAGPSSAPPVETANGKTVDAADSDIEAAVVVGGEAVVVGGEAVVVGGEVASDSADKAAVVVLDSAGKPLHGNLRDRAIARGTTVTYFADQLRPRGHNLRIWESPRNRAKVVEFAQTAKDGGIRVPISVVFEEHEILIEHGETRWLAVKLLEGDDVRGVLDGITDPKVLDLLGCLPKNTIQIKAVQAPKTNDVDRLRDTVVHNSGNQFADLELARAIKQFTDWGKSQVEIAEYLGGEAGKWTQTRVSHLNQLNFASPKLQQLLMDEKINTTTVVNAMRDHGKDAEAFVLHAIDDAKEAAAVEAESAVADAVAAQQEVERIKLAGDNSMVEPAPGKRPIPALEAAQRKATEAADKAEVAKRVAAKGPSRVSGKDIASAVLRRRPNANVRPTLSKALVTAFIDAVRFEAQYSTSELTRERMNDALKRAGFPMMPARVDNDGNELPQPEGEVEAAAAE